MNQEKWIPTDEMGYVVRCPECNYEACAVVAKEVYNFCPNCGMPMNERALEIIRNRKRGVIRNENKK